MAMSKRNKFIVLACLVVTGRFYDILTTALYTPDLKHEANPLVFFMGLGWTGLLFIQLLLVSALLYGLYYYFFKFKTITPGEPGLSFKQYISFFCFNNKYSFNKVFYETPTNKQGLVAIASYVTSMSVMFFSYLAGISTTFLLISPAYKQIYRHGIPYLMILFFVIPSIFYFAYRFFKMEYREYLKRDISRRV